MKKLITQDLQMKIWKLFEIFLSFKILIILKNIFSF